MAENVAAPPDQGFSSHHRLHTRGDYGRIFHRQQKAAGRNIVVLVSPRSKKVVPCARLGVMVSTKVHKRAVRRHQLKRWVREWFRREAKPLAEGFDVVVLFRSDPPQDGHAYVTKELHRLLNKAIKAEPDRSKQRKKWSKT